MIQAVGFDFDGTLCNSISAKKENVGILFSSYLKVDKQKVQEQYEKLSGITRKELFDKIAKAFNRAISNEEYESLSLEFDKMNDAIYTLSIIFPGVIGALELLRKEGKVLYISSSVPQKTLDRIVRKIKLRNLFDEVLGSSGYDGKGVVHTEYISTKYGINSKNIAFLGDDESDMHLSKMAKIGLIMGITNTKSKQVLMKAGANKIISLFNELLEAIKDN